MNTMERFFNTLNRTTWRNLTKEVCSPQERVRIVMIATAVFMLVANGYSWFNFYPIHDSVNHINDDGFPFFISLGRFLMPVYLELRGTGPTPLVLGLLSTLYLGVSTCVVTVFLRQRSRLELVLTSAFLSANVFMVEANTSVQWCMDLFLCALMFGCMGAYIIWQNRNWKCFLLSVVFFVISFGLYPAFVTFIGCLFVASVCIEFIVGKKDMMSLIHKLLSWFLPLAVSEIVYLILAHTVCTLSGYAFSSSSANSIFTLGSNTATFYLSRATDQYMRFFYTLGFSANYAGWAGALSSTILGGTALLLTLICCSRQKKLGLFVLTLILALLFPLASRLVNVASTNNSFRIAFAQFLLCPILVATIFAAGRCLYVERKKEAFIGKCVIVIVLLSSAVIVFGNIRYTNRAFTVQRVLYERMVFHTGQVLHDLEDMKRRGEVSAEKVTVYGKFDFGELKFNSYSGNSWVEGLNNSTGLTGFWKSQGLARGDGGQKFNSVAEYLGYSLHYKRSYFDQVKDLDEVREMPNYPDKGYIREVNGITIIKLCQ